MTLKHWAILFGIVFIVIGILGFIPGITVNGMLLGLFSVNAFHNIVHLVTGIFAFIAVAKPQYLKLYFQVVGVVYAIVTVLGFLLGGNLFLMHMNMIDNVFHLIVALIALYLGFVKKYL